MKDAKGLGMMVLGADSLPHFLANDREALLRQMATLIGEKYVTVHFSVRVSPQQRGYYYDEVLPKIAARLGHCADTMHEILKMKFNPEVVEIVNHETGEDESYIRGGSFEALGRAKRALVTEQIVIWGREWAGANIEDPTPAQKRIKGER